MRFLNMLSMRHRPQITLLGIISIFANLRVVFAIASVSILAAKVVRIYAHLAAFEVSDLLWAPTFFTQDVILLLLLCAAFDRTANSRWLQAVALLVASLITFIAFILSTVGVSFFAVSGSEIHWRNAGFVSDAASLKVLLSGLLSSIITGASLLVISIVLHDMIFKMAEVALNIVKLVVLAVCSKIPGLRRFAKTTTPSKGYAHLSQQDSLDDTEDVTSGTDDMEMDTKYTMSSSSPPQPGLIERCFGANYNKHVYGLFSVGLALQICLSVFRPSRSAYVFVSWTLLLVPILDFTQSTSILATLTPQGGKTIGYSWDERSAVSKPVQFSWLPKEPLRGFEDWYQHDGHYNATMDPLKLSNLDSDLLPELRNKLADLDIRHVVLIKLESTRKDVFPIKKNDFIYNKFANSHRDKKLPKDAERRLATLTPTANFLTGDFDDGFQHANKTPRGGLNFNNAFTSATYTMKSMTGTLCGITPLIADFNVEYQAHIYQPCLPHIFEALNQLRGKESTHSNSASDYTSYKWRSSFMQSITQTYDNQEGQMPVLGYDEENFVYKEYLQSNHTRFGKVELPDINYYGMAEVAVEDYIRDAFVTAKQDNERVFLTHFTSTAHHPFNMPEEEKYVPLSEDGGLNDLSHYTNAVGYVDRWLQKILDILDEQGVANETLLVAVGDHGIAVAEENAVTPYHNYNIGSFHVPLVISHPGMPHVTLNGAVNSIQILPTILDLLSTTGSLSEEASKAALELAANYEGQSLIRPLLVESSESDHQPDWQFTAMNPGASSVSVRSPVRPDWRLVIPVVENIEWRFTDTSVDKHEESPAVAFDFQALLATVSRRHGTEAANWCEQAAFIARWWVEENKKRYRYDGS